MKKKAIFIISLSLFATFPTWLWYYKRMLDGSDEPWGIIALLTILFIYIKDFQKKENLKHSPDLILPSIILIAYGINYAFMPKLIQAAIAMTALTATVSCFIDNKKSSLGIWGLAMLSLPIIASLQFYAGYPLRILVGEVSVVLLRISGYDVMREGAALIWGNITVIIDAPCSGIKMLWTGGYLVCLLSCIKQLSQVKTILAGAVGIAIIIFGNILRSTALFYTESGLVKLPDWGHNAIGMVSFAITAVLIIMFIQKLENKQKEQA